MDGQGRTTWECAICAEQHEGLARVFGAQAPDPWVHATPEAREAGELNADTCVLQVDGAWHYFMRGHIDIPVVDTPGDVFSWSVWVSVSEASMQKIANHWEDPARASLDPMFGWLCNELPYKASTVPIPTMVHTRKPGLVPFIELDPSVDHPLVAEQDTGISLHRLAEINHLVLG